MKRKEVDDVLEEGEGKGMDIADGECNSLYCVHKADRHRE